MIYSDNTLRKSTIQLRELAPFELDLIHIHHNRAIRSYHIFLLLVKFSNLNKTDIHNSR